MKNSGLFLDFDSTIADSADSLREVYFKFLAHFNKKGSDEEFHHLNGPPLTQVVRDLKNRHGLGEKEDLLYEKYVKAVRGAYEKVRPCPGTKEILGAAETNGWLCAVVSSNSEKVIEHWLKQNELDPYIDTIIGSESVTTGKPSAEPYLKALFQLDCQARDSYAVEDSQVGFLSARSAGIPTFLLQKSAKLERYNMAIHSLDEVIPYLTKTLKRAIP